MAKTALRNKTKTREEIIHAIRECATEIGHSPSYPELNRHKGVTHQDFRRTFGTYTRALRDAGIEARGGGHRVGMDNLFKDWAAIARALKRTPSLSEYQLNSKYSARPLLHRYGVWGNVPRGLREFMEHNGMTKQYADLLPIIAEQERNRIMVKRGQVARGDDGAPLMEPPKLLEDRPVYGPPLASAGIANGPLNETGVIFLFGTVALRLGFVVLRIQAEYPDCEAFREVAPGRWQRVHIEFEYESRRFMAHRHSLTGCDLIVCWLHNWAECPKNIQVIELKSVMRGV